MTSPDDEDYEVQGCPPDLYDEEEEALFCEMSGAPFEPDDEPDDDGTLA